MKKNSFLLVIFLFIFFFSCSFNPFVGDGEKADTENPTLIVNSPKTNSAVGKIFKFEGECKDDTSINKLTIKLDGNTYMQVKATSRFSIEIDTTEIPDGTHRFELILTDNNNNSNKKTINLLVDKTPPQFQLYSPDITSDSINRIYKSVDFIGYLADSGSGLELNDPEVNYLIIHKKGNASQILWKFKLKAGNFIFSNNNITDQIAGEYTVTANCKDLAGNNFIYSVNVVLSAKENTPVLVLEAPDPDSTTPLTTDKDLYLQGYATDNNAITRVEYNFLRDNMTLVYSTYFQINTTYRFNKLIDLEEIGLPDGNYWLVVRAVDDEGVFSPEKKARFHKDSSKPTVKFLDSNSEPTGVTPLPGAYKNSNFNIEVVCSQDNAVLEYAVEQNSKRGSWKLIQNPTSAGFPYTAIIDINQIKIENSFTDGLIRVIVRTYPSGSPDSVSFISRDFNIDQTLPVINITSHTNLQVVNGGFILAGTAFDNLSLDASIDIFNPVPNINNWVTIASSSFWQYEVATETDQNCIEKLFNLTGDQTTDATFRVRVKDMAGNEASSDVTVIVSPASDYPVLYRYMPTGTNFYASGSLTVYFRIDDDDYPAKNLYAKFELLKDGSPLSSFTTEYNSSTSDFPNCLKVIDLSSLIDKQSYTVRLTGRDWRGKEAIPIEFSFTVDQTAPVINITTPSDLTNSFSSNSIQISGTITDNNYLNNSTLYYLNHSGNMIARNLILSGPVVVDGKNVYSFNCILNGAGADTGVGGANFDWGNDIWGNSSQVFQIRATDQSGLTTTAYLNINIDNNNPEVAIISPKNNDVFGYQTDGFFDIIGGVNDTPPQGISFSLDFKNLKIDLYKNGVFVKTIKDYGVTATPGDVALGNISSFTYRWKFDNSLVDASDYSIKVEAKDNANNSVTTPVTINVIKETTPPIISLINYTQRKYYGGIVPFTINANAPNGIDQIRILVDGTTDSSFDYDQLTVFTLANEVLQFNTASLTNNTTYRLDFVIKDGAGVEMSYYVGNFTIDNQTPVINSTITYYNKDYDLPISNYSTFLRFNNIIVTDNLSLEDYEATYKVGTTNEGDEIIKERGFTRIIRSGNKYYEAVSDTYIDLSLCTTTIYITVIAPDNAGNTTKRVFTINRASGIDGLFSASFSNGAYFSDATDGVIDNYLEFKGVVSASCNKLWIKIDDEEESMVTDYSPGNTTFSHKKLCSQLSNGNHNIRIRANNASNGTQKMQTIPIIVDNFKPLITIDEKPGVLSGPVTFTGKFNDNFADKFGSKSDAGIKITINSIDYTVPESNITRNYSGIPWTWEYTFDVTPLSGNQLITVSAKDLAGNSATASITIITD